MDISFIRTLYSSVIRLKGRSSKRAFHENKARQIFRKNEHFLPPDTYTCLITDENNSGVFRGHKMGILARTFFPVKNSSDIIFFALNITVEYIQDNILAH